MPVLLAALVSLGLLTAGFAVASFDMGNSSGFSVATDRIFPAARTTAAWSVSDAGDSSAADATFSTAIGEGTSFTTTNFITTFAGTRYVEFPFNAPLPGGVATSGVSFNFDFADTTAGQTACVYFEVYVASTSTLIGTHGSSGSPVACVTGTGVTHTATTLAEVTTSNIANDLRIRVYGKESGSGAMLVDLASVSGSAYAGFTLYPTAVGDQADTTMATTTWGLAAAGDGATLATGGNWAIAFSASRYVDFTFPSETPAAATVSTASFSLSYRPATNGSSSCWYFEVYNGSGALIGTHGSTVATISCNSSNVAFQTDTVTLDEVDTGPELNGLRVRVYFKASVPTAVQFDLARLSGTYLLGTGAGCASPGLTTINATGDTYVDQLLAGTTFGSAATASAQSRSGRNRRMLVYFPMPPVPTGCSVTVATLRVFASVTNGTRTIEAWQVSTAWNEAVVTWTTQPARTGVAATSANGAGYESWTVTSLVTSMMASGNYGFQLKDQTEDAAAPGVAQIYATSEALTNIPQLDVTFG